MDHLEQELRNALPRQEPSNDFTERVLERVGQESRRESARPHWWLVPWIRWAMAAVLCVILLSGLVYRDQRRRAEGEAARRQVIVALRIAGTKMKLAQDKVQGLSRQ